MGTGDKKIVERINDKFRREKIRILAVHPSDIESLLASLDLLEKIKKREINCANCDRKVTKNIIGRIYAEGNEIKIACDRWDCFYGGSSGASDDDNDDSSGNSTIDISEEIATEQEIIKKLEEKKNDEEETEVIT